jgi:uncharacterized protein YegP (UPF0339 family)
VSKQYETYKDQAGEHRWRLTETQNNEIVGASSEGFSSEGEANKNAWRVVSGLTECLGVTQGSAEAPEWLYDAIYKLQHESPERWAELTGAFRVLLDVLHNDLELPPEIHANIERMLEDAIKPA